jgi:hypothetical protein
MIILWWYTYFYASIYFKKIWLSARILWMQLRPSGKQVKQWCKSSLSLQLLWMILYIDWLLIDWLIYWLFYRTHEPIECVYSQGVAKCMRKRIDESLISCTVGTSLVSSHHMYWWMLTAKFTVTGSTREQCAHSEAACMECCCSGTRREAYFADDCRGNDFGKN